MIDIPRDIITQAAEGNNQAFREIYNLTSGFVYSVALRITHNAADAEEVAQDVFMQIFRNLAKFRFQSSFKTWAYRITVNTAINQYRQASREKGRRKEYQGALNSQSAGDRTAEFINKESADKKVTYLLATLNPKQRACIVLRQIEGLSYQEISEVLKININTVRSRLKRAREALLSQKAKYPRNTD